MKRRPILFFITALCLLLCVSFGQAQDAQNLLSNPGFEGDFADFEGEEPRSVGAGWAPWHIPASHDSPAYANHAPHYQQVAPDTSRIRTDDNAQSYFSVYATHEGGIYQQVETAESETVYRFSIYARVWSSTFQDFEVSEEPGDVALRVGIDPTGGTDGGSSDIVWSPLAVFYYDAYRQYSVIAAAENSTITVFVMSTISTPVANSYIYLDDAVLEPVSETEIILESTPTLETTPPPTQNAATLTPTPTETPNDLIHTVRAGETLSGIAAEYGSTVAAIREANGLTPADRIFPGQRIIIPFAAQASPDEPTATPTAVSTATPASPPTITPTPTVTPTPTPALYTVQPGDTLDSIAAGLDTTIEALAQLNGILNPQRIFPGQALRIPTGGAGEVEAQTPDAYTVRIGDTLFELATRFDIDVTELARANDIINYHLIYPGQVLVIPE